MFQFVKFLFILPLAVLGLFFAQGASYELAPQSFSSPYAYAKKSSKKNKKNKANKKNKKNKKNNASKPKATQNDKLKEAGSALAQKLGIPKNNSCGKRALSFRPNNKTDRNKVFQLNPGINPNIKKWLPCFKELMNAAQKSTAPSDIHDFIYYQFLYVLDSTEKVKFYKVNSNGKKSLSSIVNKNYIIDLSSFNRVVRVNEGGNAYNAMDQSALGKLGVDLHQFMLNEGFTNNHATDAYIKIALSSMDVITDPVSKGGLNSESKCADKPDLKCSWLHAVTSTADKETKSIGTLNKGLDAAYEIYKIASHLEEVESTSGEDYSSWIKSYKKHAVQFINQLVYAKGLGKKGNTPLLSDFIPRKNGEYIQKSWLYYGVNLEKNKFYHLDEAKKACNYHLFLLRMLSDLLPELKENGLTDISGYTKKQSKLNNKSIIEFLVSSYKIKEKSKEGLYKNSKSSGEANFNLCEKGNKLSDKDLNALADL